MPLVILGYSRIQGRDDTRQDAVMQQVFALVNELLSSDRNTRSLKIRTYRVIPLSQRSGLLEWCEGTVPLGKAPTILPYPPIISIV